MRRPCLVFFHARVCFNGGPDPTWYCFSGIKLTTWEHLNVFTSINISERGVDLSTWNWIDLILSFNGVPAQERDAFLPETAETEELAQRPALR